MDTTEDPVHLKPPPTAPIGRPFLVADSKPTASLNHGTAVPPARPAIKLTVPGTPEEDAPSDGTKQSRRPPISSSGSPHKGNHRPPNRNRSNRSPHPSPSRRKNSGKQSGSLPEDMDTTEDSPPPEPTASPTTAPPAPSTTADPDVSPTSVPTAADTTPPTAPATVPGHPDPSAAADSAEPTKPATLKSSKKGLSWALNYRLKLDAPLTYAWHQCTQGGKPDSKGHHFDIQRIKQVEPSSFVGAYRGYDKFTNTIEGSDYVRDKCANGASNLSLKEITDMMDDLWSNTDGGDAFMPKNAHELSDKERSKLKKARTSCRVLTCRLAKTPLTHSPRWDPMQDQFVNPTQLDLLQLASYRKFGPVYYRLNSTSAGPKAPPRAPARELIFNPYGKKGDPKKADTTAGTTPPGALPSVTPIPPREQQPEPDQKTFVKVTFPGTDSWEHLPPKAYLQCKNTAARDKSIELTSLLWDQDPTCRIATHPTHNLRHRLRPDIAPGISNTMPSTEWHRGSFFKGSYLHKSGNPTNGIMLLRHTKPIAEILDPLKKIVGINERQKYFHFEVAKVQAADPVSVAWFYGSVPSVNCTDLAAAINRHPIMMAEPAVTVSVDWGPIFVHPEEDRTGRPTYAAHIIVPSEQYTPAMTRLMDIYNPKRKSGFPLNMKYYCLPDMGSKCYVGRNDYRPKLATIRSEQATFLESLCTKSLMQGEIVSLHEPYEAGGDTSLHRILMGVQTPGLVAEQLFLSVDVSTFSPDEVIFTFRKSLSEHAYEVTEKLGKIVTHRYGDRAWAVFDDAYKVSQLKRFTKDADLGIYTVVEETTLDDVLKQAEFEAYMIPPPAINAYCTIRNLPNSLPGPFRSHAINKRNTPSCASGSTMHSKVDALSTADSLAILEDDDSDMACSDGDSYTSAWDQDSIKDDGAEVESVDSKPSGSPVVQPTHQVDNNQAEDQDMAEADTPTASPRNLGQEFDTHRQHPPLDPPNPPEPLRPDAPQPMDLDHQPDCPPNETQPGQRTARSPLMDQSDEEEDQDLESANSSSSTSTDGVPERPDVSFHLDPDERVQQWEDHPRPVTDADRATREYKEFEHWFETIHKPKCQEEPYQYDPPKDVQFSAICRIAVAWKACPADTIDIIDHAVGMKFSYGDLLYDTTNDLRMGEDWPENRVHGETSSPVFPLCFVPPEDPSLELIRDQLMMSWIQPSEKVRDYHLLPSFIYDISRLLKWPWQDVLSYMLNENTDLRLSQHSLKRKIWKAYDAAVDEWDRTDQQRQEQHQEQHRGEEAQHQHQDQSEEDPTVGLPAPEVQATQYQVEQEPHEAMSHGEEE